MSERDPKRPRPAPTTPPAPPPAAPVPAPPAEGVLEQWDRDGANEALFVLVPDDLDLTALPEPPPAPEPEPEPAPPPPPPEERPTQAEVQDDVRRELDEELAFAGDRDDALFRMPRLYRLLALGALPLAGLLVFAGLGYYQAPLAARPLHHLHGALRPSGLVGLPLGVAGTALTASTMVYVLRKRLVSRPRFAALRSSMGYHVFAGLLGPLLVLLHSAFVPSSALGLLSLGSLAIVVLSGVLGRYVYARFPKTLDGRALELRVVEKRLVAYRHELDALGDDAGALEPAARARVLLLERRLVRERQWAATYDGARRLMGMWRFLHTWLAVVTGLAVTGHIAVAVAFGNLWIFGGRR